MNKDYLRIYNLYGFNITQKTMLNVYNILEAGSNYLYSNRYRCSPHMHVTLSIKILMPIWIICRWETKMAPTNMNKKWHCQTQNTNNSATIFSISLIFGCLQRHCLISNSDYHRLTYGIIDLWLNTHYSYGRLTNPTHWNADDKTKRNFFILILQFFKMLGKQM